MHDLRAASESGQGLVEYALILLLVALGAVIALGAFGVSLSAYYDNIVASF